MTDAAARQRAAFARDAARHMLTRFHVDVTVVDLGDSWHALRTDGVPLTIREDFAFRMFLRGYRLANRHV